MKTIDRFLNNITMYRLVLYYLIFLLCNATVLSYFKLLPYNPIHIVLSTLFLVYVSIITNWIFSKTFEAVTNVESLYISALILALIIDPAKSPGNLAFLFWAAVLTTASKYIISVNKKHLFNPVALAVVITAISTNQSASWWVGNAYMLPLVLVGGLLIVRKVNRFDLVFYFLFTTLTYTFSSSLLNGSSLAKTAESAVLYSPVLFFAFVMLTEPLTTPPTKLWQCLYGATVGILFAPKFHIGTYFFTPETALLAGNVFSYALSPGKRLILQLKKREGLGSNIYNFIFTKKGNLDFKFKPGQYMEWTIDADNNDSRGNRRYITIASSPTENEIQIGIRFNPNPSTFKQQLLKMREGNTIVATQLMGDFTMPKDTNIKLVFIAGGIGITPFRSMIKYLLDKNEKRDIVLFYSNKVAEDIAYADVFEEAKAKLGLKTVYTLTDSKEAPLWWQGKSGFIDEQMIKTEVPDFKQRVFYISGPQAMVTNYKEMLEKAGVNPNHIKNDYFPGFA